jgi:hybrid cluster-associated redox disulfide protein
MGKITKETNLAEILKNPELEKILMKYNFPCLSCPMAKFEFENLKIGQVCELYGIEAEKLIKELNTTLK